ncbi:MAG: hypothetical protein IH627_11510 [Rubrivivax sp.]|nr:hypothetical protein [Rubrivivax sp.]
MAYEEQRLGTPLPNTGATVVTTDTTPIADRLLKDTGFDGFAPRFATELCGADSKTTLVSYDAALQAVKASGTELWRAAVDRVQGRRASPAGSVLPNSDDRMLYWARVQMTKALRQWNPSFDMTPTQREELQWQLERSSRGQYDINLPEGSTAGGKKYRRMIVSGFDTFTLGTPGTPNTGLRNGNPSGATALEMDGREVELADGSILHVESYILPVSYDPFHKGMQEDTLGPFFKPGPKRVDASISMSQGGRNQFWLEAWNARFHGISAGNDGMIYCPSGESRLPAFTFPIGTVTKDGTAPISMAGSGCNINPPARWLGYDVMTTWMKDFPRQFTTASLPGPAMVTGNTGKGITRPPGATSEGTEGFDVTWHTNYTYFSDCNVPTTTTQPSTNLMNRMPDMSTVPVPNPAWCSQAGGGGNYLSNESAYRNTLLRDTFGLDIPAGHIHVPVMTNFFGGTPETGDGTRNDNAITDPRFEAYRTAIVAQTKALLVVVGNSLAYK